MMMMKSSFGRWIACTAWVGALTLSAVPVDARALAKVSGAPYANCSSNWESYFINGCGIDFYVVQRIMMVSQPCNTGGCGDNGGIMVEYVYGPGRKTADQVADCGAYSYLYQLGDCAC